MPEDVDLERLPYPLQRNVDDRSTLHHPGVEDEHVGIEGACVLDVGLIEQVELDHLKLNPSGGSIGPKAADQWPRLGGRDDFVSAAGEFDRRSATESRTCPGDQNLLRHHFLKVLVVDACGYFGHSCAEGACARTELRSNSVIRAARSGCPCCASAGPVRP